MKHRLGRLARRGGGAAQARRGRVVRRAGAAEERGQALVVVVAGLIVLALAALFLAAVARGLGVRSDAQRAADLAALAGARAMLAAYPRLFEPAGEPGSAALDKASYLALGRDAASAVARANGAAPAAITFPDGDTFAPVRIKVAVGDTVEVGAQRVEVEATAEAELAPDGERGSPRWPTAAATTARSPTGRASRCARTWPPRSTGWRLRRAPTACTWS